MLTFEQHIKKLQEQDRFSDSHQRLMDELTGLKNALFADPTNHVLAHVLADWYEDNWPESCNNCRIMAHNRHLDNDPTNWEVRLSLAETYRKANRTDWSDYLVWTVLHQKAPIQDNSRWKCWQWSYHDRTQGLPHLVSSIDSVFCHTRIQAEYGMMRFLQKKGVL